jgi:hypothetical protein
MKKEKAAFNIGMHPGKRGWCCVFQCLGASEDCQGLRRGMAG